jgi:hypothetical protein
MRRRPDNFGFNTVRRSNGTKSRRLQGFGHRSPVSAIGKSEHGVREGETIGDAVM